MTRLVPSGGRRRPPGAGPDPSVLVLTDDPLLARHVLAVVAAVGLEAVQPGTDEALRRAWRSAGAVLVGLDAAERTAASTLPTRDHVVVVGHDEELAAVSGWAGRLRAATATLPAGGADLAVLLSRLRASARQADVVALAGGSGGVGASTLAAALALRAARDGRRVLLLDADPQGGGLDVLLGAEDLAGWRWGSLATARGHLGDLTGSLPCCEGVDVLAPDRGRPGASPPDETALAAVLDSALTTHDLVVVDVPRSLPDAVDAALARASTVLLLTRADVRGVAAADATAGRLAPRCRELEVVVRTGRGHRLDPGLVADALDLPLAGVLEEDRSLPEAAERGEPPGRAPRSALVRLCDELCVRLLAAEEVA